MGTQNVQWSSKIDLSFDSRLRIKVTALWSFPICLYREAIRLQCFLPTLYVRGAVLRTYECGNHYLICSNMLMHASKHCVATSYPFLVFFCFLCQPRGLKKKTIKKSIVHGQPQINHYIELVDSSRVGPDVTYTMYVTHYKTPNTVLQRKKPNFFAFLHFNP